MAKYLFIDVETFSSVDIKDSGAYKYIESPDFEILIIGYALDDGPVNIVDLAQGEEMPEEFEEALLDPECIKVAHNAVFERLSFKRIGYNVPAEQWYCTSVKAAYCGLPLSLDGVSKALNLTDKKLDTGKHLLSTSHVRAKQLESMACVLGIILSMLLKSGKCIRNITSMTYLQNVRYLRD